MANPFDDINSDFEGGQRPTTDELHRREEIEKLKSNRQMREKYAERAYWFACITLVFWAMLIILRLTGLVELNTADLGIITGACTVNILAAFITVIKGLFASNEK